MLQTLSVVDMARSARYLMISAFPSLPLRFALCTCVKPRAEMHESTSRAGQGRWDRAGSLPFSY